MATCTARHHGACTDLLTTPQVIAALDLHGVQTRTVDTVAGPIVEAWESATMRGTDGVVRDVSSWIVAPRTIHALAEWLGY